ncbi:MAG: serine/threonine protein kinase [Polyangiaceae bacterium]
MKKRYGRYELGEKVAEGGMAAVYQARLRGEAGFEKTVALKLLLSHLGSDPTYQKMFLDEARIVARLDHPNLVEVYDLGKEGDDLYMAMELVVGKSLAEIWDASQAKGVRIRGDVVAWIGARVAEGLHHAHEMRDASGTPQSLVHRDVSPSNILITFEGQVKLIDFGLVHAADRLSKTSTGIVKGQLAYLSPEQTVGRVVDRRSDLFSLAVTLWELSADRRLFKEEVDEETVQRIRDAAVEDPTAFVPDYPSLLWLVLKRALARAPEERYATAADLARDLDGVARVEGSILQAATLAEIMRALFGSGPPASTYLVRTRPDAPVVIRTPSQQKTIVKRRRPWMEIAALGAIALVVLLGGVALGMSISK